MDDGGIATGTVLANAATVAFTAQDLGTRDTVTTAPARTAIAVPDVAIAKSHSPALVSGGASTYSIDVTNAGDAATRGTVTVEGHAGRRPDRTGPATAAGWTCTGTRAITARAPTRWRPAARTRRSGSPCASRPAPRPARSPTRRPSTATPDGSDDDDTVADAGAVSAPELRPRRDQDDVEQAGSDPTRYVPGEQVDVRDHVDQPRSRRRAATPAVVDTCPPRCENISGT